MPLQVSVPEILDEHAAGILQDVHVSVPAKIVSWTTTGLATVQPTVRKPLQSMDDQLVYETLPEIKNVPCYIQAAGGFLCSMPYAAGDPVLLIFSEQSYAEWLATGQISNPKDIRRHGIGYPFAIPGPRPTSLALQDVNGSAMVIGKDGSDQQIVIDSSFILLGKMATSFVALAAKVNSELSKIEGALGAATAPSGGGPVTYGTAAYIPSDVSSTITKAE